MQSPGYSPSSYVSYASPTYVASPYVSSTYSYATPTYASPTVSPLNTSPVTPTMVAPAAASPGYSPSTYINYPTLPTTGYSSPVIEEVISPLSTPIVASEAVPPAVNPYVSSYVSYPSSYPSSYPTSYAPSYPTSYAPSYAPSYVSSEWLTAGSDVEQQFIRAIINNDQAGLLAVIPNIARTAVPWKNVGLVVSAETGNAKLVQFFLAIGATDIAGAQQASAAHPEILSLLRS